MAKLIELGNPAAKAEALVKAGNGVYEFAPYSDWHNATELPGARVLVVPESRRAFSHLPTERLQVIRFNLDVPEVDIFEAAITPGTDSTEPVGNFKGHTRRRWMPWRQPLRTYTAPEVAGHMEEIIADVWTAYPKAQREYLASLK